MSARVLFIDVETKPIVAHVWGLWDNNVGLNQIVSDWSILSYAAKWQGSKKVIQSDLRHCKAIGPKSDKALMVEIAKLLDEAQVVVTQNGKAFDIKKINSRLVTHGIKPPSSFKQIDTKLLAKKHFAFPSNKLEYMTNLLNKKYKKLTNRKFQGHDLWTGCLNGNQSAWREMAKYNKLDVLSLEELYNKLIPWDNSVNFNLYTNDVVCSCGSKEFTKNGHFYAASGKYQRYSCKKCGSEFRDRRSIRTVVRVGTVR